MIVTRRRKKKRNPLPILLPLAALAMLAVALSWPPSRRIIVNGPLRPVARVWFQIARPLTFAYQQQQITDRNIEIRQLNDQLEAERKATSDRDTQIQTLQKQLAAANAPAPAASASAAPVARSTGGAGFGAPASPETDALRQTGEQWSAMDPQKAADLIATLPESYVVKVFAQMDPDDVGAVMDELPAKVAARIVQASAQLSAASSR